MRTVVSRKDYDTMTAELEDVFVPTERDYEQAREALHEAWNNCKMVNSITSRVGHPCDCDHSLVAGCKAKVEAIARAIAAARRM